MVGFMYLKVKSNKSAAKKLPRAKGKEPSTIDEF